MTGRTTISTVRRAFHTRAEGTGAAAVQRACEELVLRPLLDRNRLALLEADRKSREPLFIVLRADRDTRIPRLIDRWATHRPAL